MSNSDALRAAKQLTRQWPHANPPDPAGWLQGLADTLRRYPQGIVDECTQSGSGLVLEREFPPTAAAIVEWCDRRLSFYQALVAWKPRAPALPAPEYSEEHCAVMREKIAAIPGTYFK